MHIPIERKGTDMNVEIVLYITRKYPLRGYILGSGAPGTPGVNP